MTRITRIDLEGIVFMNLRMSLFSRYAISRENKVRFGEGAVTSARGERAPQPDPCYP